MRCGEVLCFGENSTRTIMKAEQPYSISYLGVNCLIASRFRGSRARKPAARRRAHSSSSGICAVDGGRSLPRRTAFISNRHASMMYVHTGRLKKEKGLANLQHRSARQTADSCLHMYQPDSRVQCLALPHYSPGSLHLIYVLEENITMSYRCDRSR
jgi:hypothetical protein